MTKIISPYGGKLINLISNDTKLFGHAQTVKPVTIPQMIEYDLELLSVGAFSPLSSFMTEAELNSVIIKMRLLNGMLFPIPIFLPIDDSVEIKLGEEVAIRNTSNQTLALIKVSEIYTLNKNLIADYVIGSRDSRHPYLSEINSWGKRAITGELQVFDIHNSHDFKHLRNTPKEVRKELEKFGKNNVVAFQTRNPLHRVHETLTKKAQDKAQATLLLHPVVGTTKPGDVDRFTRIRAYEALLENYYKDRQVLLSLLPLAMRMAGPREALWHMMIRRNFGASHMIIGRDHAGPGKNSQGEDYYAPYGAQELAKKYSKEIGVKVISFRELYYLPDEDRYEEEHKIANEKKVKKISGSQVREKYLKNGKKLPKWFTRPEVAKILSQVYKPMHKRGFCIWLTGLSGSGKSTLAKALDEKFQESGRAVTLLDGDIVRTHLSKGLTFSREDRDTNIRRIGFVASEIVKHDGLVIASAISPYQKTRDEVRNMVGAGFIEVFVDTPLAVCEERDVKGLYKKARTGEIKNFTGISAPYEKPKRPEVHIRTQKESLEESVEKIIDKIKEMGYIK